MAKKKDSGPRRGGGGLGDLGKALREAGVIDEKDAKKIAHKERVRKKDVGREGVEKEKRQKEKALEEAQRDKRSLIEAAQKQHDDESQSAFIDRLIAGGTVQRSGRGKRFHFVARSGRIPFVEADDATTRQLVEGRAGIVEVPGQSGRQHVVIAGRDRLQSIRDADAELVRFWNQS